MPEMEGQPASANKKHTLIFCEEVSQAESFSNNWQYTNSHWELADSFVI